MTHLSPLKLFAMAAFIVCVGESQGYTSMEDSSDDSGSHSCTTTMSYMSASSKEEEEDDDKDWIRESFCIAKDPLTRLIESELPYFQNLDFGTMDIANSALRLLTNGEKYIPDEIFSYFQDVAGRNEAHDIRDISSASFLLNIQGWKKEIELAEIEAYKNLYGSNRRIREGIRDLESDLALLERTLYLIGPYI